MDSSSVWSVRITDNQMNSGIWLSRFRFEKNKTSGIEANVLITYSFGPFLFPFYTTIYNRNYTTKMEMQVLVFRFHIISR